MAQKQQAKAPEKRIFTPRFIFRVLVAAVVLSAAAYAWHKTEQFLIRDARFAVALPDYGLESPAISLNGLQYTSRIQVLRIFAPDYGRSLYVLPLKERRAQLLQLDWVKEASIARLWPDRVVVQVQEREPVAFVKLPSAQPNFWRISLIDADGKILQPPAHARFTLPVATGIPEDESAFDRRSRVRRLMQLMKEVGALGSRISEIHLSDPDNLKVTTSVGNRSVVLLLGDRNFGQRFENFVNHYGKIQERLAGAEMLDMRLEDRIAVAEGSNARTQ